MPLSEEEILGLSDDVFILGWFTPEPAPDSPLKNEDVRGYVLSNGQKGYVHLQTTNVVDRQPGEIEGIELQVDYDTNTYHARPLTSQEKEEIRQSLDYSRDK